MHQVLGFRVKSGRATAVVLGGSRAEPQALHRRIVLLSDPELPESKQPYHARAGVLEEGRETIDRRTRAVREATERSVDALLSEQPAAAAALVVGSLIDPARIANPHIRAHALEGQLFRTTLEQALEVRDVRCVVMLEKGLRGAAAELLGREAEELERAVSRLGRGRLSPWRADEKQAALAAWTQLP